MVIMLLIFAFVMSLIINFGRRMIHDEDQQQDPKTNKMQGGR